MLTFKKFITEGGNVQIGEYEAERIDLSKIDRSSIVTRINRTLQLVNLMFKKKYGLPLWNEELFANKKFLSGSAFHFFNKAIPTPEFKQYKSTVGDIDTQVDAAQEDNIREFLKSITGEKFSYVTFIGFKETAGQFITLWQFSAPQINIQIDMEMVDFEKGQPTEWSQFSHSSPWADMKEGIKGVFQKYILRALTSRTLKDVYILKMKGRGKARAETPELTKSNTLAFSVQYGLRDKLEPVIEDGKQKHIDGIPVFRELPAGTPSSYVKDLAVIFEILFGVKPTPVDLELFSSFTGCLALIKKYLSKEDAEKIISGFSLIIFGKGAQGLYRGNPALDQKEKMTAFLKMHEILGIPYDEKYDEMRVTYYETYKEG